MRFNSSSMWDNLFINAVKGLCANSNNSKTDGHETAEAEHIINKAIITANIGRTKLEQLHSQEVHKDI
jgi:hypothetical protein